MVLLYMVCHGSHQYTPVMLALIYQHHGSYGIIHQKMGLMYLLKQSQLSDCDEKLTHMFHGAGIYIYTYKTGCFLG
jgi:hypothetical protein